MQHHSKLSLVALVAAIVAALIVPLTAAAATAAAKVVYALGEVSARDATGARRTLAKGDLLVAGDTVITVKGRAQVQLTDGGFVALNPATEYAIEDYSFDSATPDSGHSFFNLLKGGVRLVTGAIGRSNRANWRMRTTVATIGIRGSGGFFFYVPGLNPGDPERLRINVDYGGFTATDPSTNVENPLDPGQYICQPACSALDGPSGPEDASYLDIENIEDQRYAAGQDLLAGVGEEGPGPIPAGAAPAGTHISVSFSFTENNLFGSPPVILAGLADGVETEPGTENDARFGSLEEFSFFTGFPCEPCVYTRNGAQEIVDRTGPDSPNPNASFNTALSAEWGRVVGPWNMVDATGGQHTYVSHFHWVASTMPTPDAGLPAGGVMVYDKDVGGTLATHTFGTSGATEVATARTNVRIEVDYGADSIEDFRISGGFPSGTSYLLQSASPTSLSGSQGSVFFSHPTSHITVPGDACSSGCTTGNSEFFSAAVFGPAGPNAEGFTGSFHGATYQFFGAPPHSLNGTFIVQP